jgi:hypothetical protein
MRAYGIPKKNISLKVLEDILKIVGTPSEFHRLQENMIFSHPDYIRGVVRHKVCNPVFGGIKLNFSPGENGTIFLHYEKMGTICLFCGVMFHIIENCHLRQSIITDRLQHDRDP